MMMNAILIEIYASFLPYRNIPAQWVGDPEGQGGILRLQELFSRQYTQLQGLSMEESYDNFQSEMKDTFITASIINPENVMIIQNLISVWIWAKTLVKKRCDPDSGNKIIFKDFLNDFYHPHRLCNRQNQAHILKLLKYPYMRLKRSTVLMGSCAVNWN